MNKWIYWSLLLILGSGQACQNGANTEERAATLPIEVPVPEGTRFDYLIFENDFNTVPKDGKLEEYSNEVRASDGAGMSFMFTNKREFSPGIIAKVEGAKPKTWYHLSFDCYKDPKDVVADAEANNGFLVISFSRNGQGTHYKQYNIREELKKQNRQFVDKWERLELWYEVPEDVQNGDQLKIYHWNPAGGTIYLDNFFVEAWTQLPEKPANIQLSHGIAEQNYETPDLEKQTSSEFALRGIKSCKLVAGAGQVQYGAGFTGTLKEAGLRPGDYLKISFAALKTEKTRFYNETGRLVVSLKEKEEGVFWQGYAIHPRLSNAEGQVTGDWVRLTYWQQIPDNVAETALLQVYAWNPQNQVLYIDDLLVEVWRPIEATQ